MLPLTASQIPALYKQALSLQQRGQMSEARQIYQRIALAKPDLAEVPFQLGRIAAAEGQWGDSVKALQTAHSLKPREPAILEALAQAHQNAGDTEAAIACHERLAKLFPKSVKPHADKALLLQQSGQFDKAERAFRRALKMAPKDGELYRIFLGTKKLAKGDPMITAMRKLWAEPELPARSRTHLGFALAKAMEDSGAYDQVFKYLNPANAGQRLAFPFDLSQRVAEVDGLIAAYKDADFQPAANAVKDIAPIFVTGLPRSGTTLIEQIIASHPAVTGGGELSIGLPATYAQIGNPGDGFKPLCDVDLAALGRTYAEKVRKALSFDTCFTDKAIQTHLVIGHLHAALPRARFIVVERDPRDTLLSIYKNIFADGTHGYAYDLAELAGYYHSYRRIVDFWKAKLPGVIHEVRYEDVVADLEPEARALIQAAGLEWDPACLAFHHNTRAVKTLSLHQVRQPIYGGSVAAWKRYENELQPLIKALESQP